MFFVHQRGSVNGLYFGAITAGAFLTPMAAGAHAVGFGWRASYMTLGTVMIALNLIFVTIFEETKFVPVMQGASDPGDNDSIFKHKLDLTETITETDRDTEDGRSVRREPFPRYLRLQLVTKTDESLWKSFCSPIHMWWFPHIFYTSLQMGSGICWVVILASVTSITFSAPPYNFDAAQVGFMSAGPCIGTLFGSLYGGPLVDWAIVWLSKRNGGLFEPEMRLYLYPIPAITMSGGLVIFGVTASQASHFSLSLRFVLD